MLVEAVIMKIEHAAADYLNPDGTIRPGCKQRVEDWERQRKIKLYWNSWFEVSGAQFCLDCQFGSDCGCDLIVQYRVLGERFLIYSSIVWCFMHMATIGFFGRHFVSSVLYTVETTLRNDLYITGHNKKRRKEVLHQHVNA